ncbi:MAG: SprA-related family protein [Proteobacteria bacterium]|nr:SprA-related family protein [Pseudomonadota bacterium]MBU1584959.1 SprA-related family protein [Pseudomonadota bacterium]MBU2455245.1 SprA-related family protein [Pseudomonadota bacterium]MBU2628938.1 SprA-related family protein [Pseudomonadota bacterium]
MNISPITYSNYQSGFTYNPVSRTKPDDTNPFATPFAKNNPSLNPVVNTKASEPISQISKADKNQQENTPSNPETSETHTGSDTTQVFGQALTQPEMRLLEELKQVDTEVRRHEMAHVAAGGRYITSGANFTYQRGPDGKNYAIGGEVGIDTSPVPGDPQATIQKMRQIKSAALAPANPSSQDLKVASKATSAVSKALSDLMILQAKEQATSNETKAFGNLKKAADTYQKVNDLPQDDTASFQIAV